MFEKREINLAVLVFMVTLLMFGGIMFVSYATDTYATIGNLNKTAYSMITRNGRPVIAAFFSCMQYSWNNRKELSYLF